MLRRDPGELKVCQLLSGGDGLGVLDLDGLLPALLPNCCRMNCHRLDLQVDRCGHLFNFVYYTLSK